MKKRNLNKQHKSRLTRNHVLVIILAVLVGVQVYLSNREATSGRRISELETRAEELETENRKLLAESVDKFSLKELTEKAKELGYVEPDAVISIGADENTVALR